MKAEKKVLENLTKCYSIAPLHFKGTGHFLVAAEKEDRCLLFDTEGNIEDTVWTGPGGVMTMVQVPGTDGQFLATHKFYSPNDSKEAKIVIVTPRGKGDWEVRTLADLPHVHRFDILERNGVRYLLACTLKSGHQYKEDWSSPGKVYAAVLPRDLSVFDENNQLELTVIKDDMVRNHGYYRIREGSLEEALICSESGVYRFAPPESVKKDWEITRLLDTPASDSVLVDFDEDGEMELAVLSPFHGDRLTIYKKQENGYEKVYEHEKPLEFLHAVYGGGLCGRKALVVGHRKGDRNLLAFTWNKKTGKYEWEILDGNCGPANVYHYTKDGKDILISANRETDEIAMYTVTP